MPRKVPRRDASFMTDVPGVYIIGDVSGTPLIKNAANEGAAVVIHIAHELHASNGNGGPPQAQYDVAIIGAGPAGLSGAVMAKRLGLRFIGIEQDTVMSTIVKYPKGKYVFLKPETMEWTGGIRLPGLEEYVEEMIEEMMDEPQRAQAAALLAAERAGTLDRATPRKTCAVCHDGYVDPVTKQTVIPADKPNCNSCHVQHVEDKRHWNPSLFSQPQQATGNVLTTNDVSLLAQSGH